MIVFHVMDNLLKEYQTLTHPLEFFKGWSVEEFKDWLYLDPYGQKLDKPIKIFLLNVLDILEPFPELDDYYKEVLKNLK